MSIRYEQPTQDRKHNVSGCAQTLNSVFLLDESCETTWEASANVQWMRCMYWEPGPRVIKKCLINLKEVTTDWRLWEQYFSQLAVHQQYRWSFIKIQVSWAPIKQSLRGWDVWAHTLKWVPIRLNVEPVLINTKSDVPATVAKTKHKLLGGNCRGTGLGFVLQVFFNIFCTKPKLCRLKHAALWSNNTPSWKDSNAVTLSYFVFMTCFVDLVFKPASVRWAVISS